MSPRLIKTVLKQLREEKGMSQLELARRSGVTQGYISAIESGNKKHLGVAVLKKLAKGLGVPVTELLG